ncbi:MAG: hypothetical protein COB37_08965 [Kordiimonadales bacterium]|nr:MAG: hypothetical protein COB37_08965 [Kordiimonadales bacterium]
MARNRKKNTNEPKQHNKRLSKALGGLITLAESTTSNKVLAKGIVLFEELPKPVDYIGYIQKAWQKLLLGITRVVLSILASFFSMVFVEKYTDLQIYIILFLGILFLFLLLKTSSFLIKKFTEVPISIEAVSDFIYGCSELNANNLKPQEFDATSHAQHLAKKYKSFRKGDTQGRRTGTFARGHHQGAEHSFDFDYFTFHYYEIIGDHVTSMFRTGILLKFPFAQDFFLEPSNSRKRAAHIARHGLKTNRLWPRKTEPSWKSPSISFNEQIAVRAKNSMAAAKFFSPSILKAIEDLDSMLTLMDMEFTSNYDLCISCSDGGLLKKARRYSLKHPYAFSLEIAADTGNPTIQQILKAVHTLMKYSDNNFDQKPDLTAAFETEIQTGER